MPEILSVIIPGRCEKYFQATIDDILEHAEEDIEVIPVIDGYIPNPPLKITEIVLSLYFWKNP